MAANSEDSWEIVDGLQRLTAVAKFCGNESQRAIVKQPDILRLSSLKKLEAFNGKTFADLPLSLQSGFMKRAFKVVTLSDKSDIIVRFDLFERLNRGGLKLSKQEIRHCVIRGEFAGFLEEMGQDSAFRSVVRLKSNQEADATREECVLRFFAFLYDRESFEHLVDDFLTEYMEKANNDFDYITAAAEFRQTFEKLAEVFPNGIMRHGKKKSKTSLILFEGVSVGAALAIRESGRLSERGLDWLANEELKRNTTGATNNKPAVNGRIDFCRDMFLGKPEPE
ncbi:hypothetical protein Mal33_50380 [Rosistilla oblonga]|uniref:GmrSD restriction endonucleases N-terminal domain-containing protein n=2 Tax=Rosistilla oblonga TaxID=2527990 RepID=A0A518J0Z1_9BACT|nr:hypothetical protein Mal33_50380 [Rosistilla oblonga]